MKSILPLLIAMGTATMASAAPLYSSTIDFLDYVFMYQGKENHFPLEVYEAELKKLADHGIKKVYLRVNVCGTTHYPSCVSAQYGWENAFHWNATESSKRLIETYRYYNPCLETIRLGHKYGMEVWAWESLFDDAGVKYGETGVTPEYQGIYDKLDGWALLDPWYLDNMDAFAMRDPKRLISDDEIAEANRKAFRLPIASIVLTNAAYRANRPPSRIKSPADLDIMTSKDNRSYVKYEGTFTIHNSVTEDNRNRFEIRGLNITDPYVRLIPKNMPKDEGYTLILSKERGQGEIYNTEGELVDSVWGYAERPENMLNFSFSTPNPSSSVAWDYGTRNVGFKVGLIPNRLMDKYYYGVAEFNVPKAMKHKVDRFIELARYNFDGFMFNTRCHSARNQPQQFGFNPEVLAKFRQRYGHDVQDTPEDLAGLFQLRAEAIAEFFKNCKAQSHGRPIYLSGPMPLEKKGEPGYNSTFGPLPWLYKQYFKDGSIDGVLMIGPNFNNGPDFSNYFTPEVTGGKDIKIGIFREMLNCPKDYDIKADIEACTAAGLDEMEFYESLVLGMTPWFGDLLQGNITDWSIEKYRFGWSKWY